MMRGGVIASKDNLFAEARKHMSERLKDPHLRFGYTANIAMAIYDNQNNHKFLNRNLLDTIPGCNAMAEKLVQLIFDGE